MEDRGETSSSMDYICDWFAPVARVIWERTGDGNCWHPRSSQCVSRTRTWWWWMAYGQVACGCEEQRSAVLAAVFGVLGYSLRDRPYSKWQFTLKWAGR